MCFLAMYVVVGEILFRPTKAAVDDARRLTTERSLCGLHSTILKDVITADVSGTPPEMEVGKDG